ncbi:MAG: hypothetical protein ACI8X3_001201, partial [Saprospiraceae bacterium]
MRVLAYILQTEEINRLFVFVCKLFLFCGKFLLIGKKHTITVWNIRFPHTRTSRKHPE